MREQLNFGLDKCGVEFFVLKFNWNWEFHGCNFLFVLLLQNERTTWACCKHSKLTSHNPIRCRKSSFLRPSQPLILYFNPISFYTGLAFFIFSSLLRFGLVFLRSRVALGLIYCLPDTLADCVNWRPNPYRIFLSNWIFSNYFGSKCVVYFAGPSKGIQIKRSINNPWTFEVQSVMGL